MYMADDDIFRFDVPMGDVVVMEVFDGGCDLADLGCYLGLWQFLVSFQVGEEGTFVHVLQD